MEAQNASTDATLTEYLPAGQNADPSITGAAKIENIKVGNSWQTDEGESLHEVTRYGVECSCGETFDTWGEATKHVDESH